MDKQTISFRLETKKVDALDALAETLDRDRSYLLNEAINSYLEIQQWQIEHIKKGLQEANSGDIVSHAKVKKMAARWRPK
jgi:RHH-type transcriptional regulator, rel operon repressor / antitoxin RelB